jgi:hypothetical protein
MNCSDARALSTPAIDNELTVELAAKFNQHVDECSDCRETWDSALHIRTGVKEILESFPPTTTLESKILADLSREERQTIRIWRNKWMLAVACVVPLILFVALGTPHSSKVSDSQSVQANNYTLTVNDLISKTSHADEEPPATQYADSITSQSISLSEKSKAGFPIIDANLVAYKLGGAEILVTQNKKIVRMCFKTDGDDLCIDCYQAPSGVIALNKSPDVRTGDEIVSTSSVGKINLVMFTKAGVDVVYASELPKEQLLKLVQPNV